MDFLNVLLIVLLYVLVAVIGLAIYLIPSIVAVKTNHPNSLPIIALNVLGGWTFIVWVFSLVWALTKPSTYQAGGNSYQLYAPGPVMPRKQAQVDADYYQGPLLNAQEAEPARPLLVGVKGLFADQVIDLEDSPVAIGRDANVSHLVYPHDSMISRKHCVVGYDREKKKFILEDSSQNGTFIYPQDRLSNGSPVYLEAGARFYLADPDELYELRYG